jgi:hypothetical protein
VRPIQNLPAGINAIPSGAAPVCAAIDNAGNAAQMQQNSFNTTFVFILNYWLRPIGLAFAAAHLITGCALSGLHSQPLMLIK